jgi:hypothetical protein
LQSAIFKKKAAMLPLRPSAKRRKKMKKEEEEEG